MARAALIVAPLAALFVAGAAVPPSVHSAVPPPPASSAAPLPPGARYSLAALYDSANAEARAGRFGRAVLDYERARLLAPRDPDVLANLRVVRRSAGLADEPDPWLGRTLGAIDPTLVSALGLLGMLLLAGAAWTARLAPARPRIRHAALILGLALIAITILHAAAIWPRLQEAIVVVSAAPAHVSPAPMGEISFTLKGGEAVRTVGEHEGFVLVRSGGGRVGWIWHTDVAAVVPQDQ